MYYFFAVLGIASFCFMIGFLYRFSAIVVFIAYTWQFLIDKTDYNNHYYLMSIVSFVWIFLNPHHRFSVDSYLGWVKESPVVPRWNIWVLKLQIAIVYFYGGIAKINWDWLQGEPMRHWLYQRGNYPIIGDLFKTEFAAYFFSYGGLLFDLAAPFLLWKRQTRIFIIPLVIFFHASNHFMYSIGVFPVLMICTTVLFLERETIAAAIRKLFRFDLESGLSEALNLVKFDHRSWKLRIIGYGVVVYVLLQLLLPFRHHLYKNYVSWSEEAHNFSWHMKLRDKKSFVRLTVVDPNTGLNWPVKLDDHLTPRQIRKMSSRPHMLIEYVRFVAEDISNRLNIRNPVIQAEVLASLNFRPFRRLVHPKANLAAVHYSPFSNNDWITPFDPSVMPLPMNVDPRTTLREALETKNY